MKTCDSCPWDCEYGRAGESRRYLTTDSEGETVECPPRKAFRVCRDEIRRLRYYLWERDYYLKIVKRQRAHIEHMAEKMTDLDIGPEIKS